MSAIFSNILKRLRSENGLSQKDLADDLAVSQVTVYRWENGYEPSMERLIKIADYFNVTIESLFGESIIPPRRVKNTQERELLDIFDKLTKSSKEKFVGIGKVLLDSQDDLG